MSTSALWLLLVVQALCATFFMFDSALDALGWEAAEFKTTQTFEYIVTVVLVGGVALAAWELRRVHRAQARVAAQLRAASGAFEEVLLAHFDQWGLTAAERDVARMALKGLSVADIARVRDTAEGTVKAQSTAIYRKAGVSGRQQLMSVFVEELMGDGLALPSQS